MQCGLACPKAPALAVRGAPAGLFSEMAAVSAVDRRACRSRSPLLKCGWNHLHAALAGGARAVSVWVNSGSQSPAGRVIHHLLLLSAQMTGYQRGHPGHPA